MWKVRLADALFEGVAAMGLGLLFNVPGRFIPLLGLGELPPAAVPPEMGTHTLQTLLKTAFTIAALIFGVIFPIFLIEGRSPRV